MGPPYGKLPILFPYFQGFLWEWYGKSMSMGNGFYYCGSLKIPLRLSAEEEEDETVVRSFPKMCAFSVEVMGQELEIFCRPGLC